MDKKDTFKKSIQENERLIYKVASFYTDCNDDREDLAQEIIYSLWKSFDTFKHNSSINTWIYRVGMNDAILHLKRSKRKVASVPIEVDVLNLSEPDLNVLKKRG